METGGSESIFGGKKVSMMSRSSIDTFDPQGMMQREEPATSLRQTNIESSPNGAHMKHLSSGESKSNNLLD